MKQLLTALLLTVASISYSQETVNLENVSSYTGDSVTVTGMVHGIRYLDKSGGKPTLINLGYAYPNQLLTLVIWDKDRASFSAAPENLYANQRIRVSGKVELFKGKPQMVIYSAKQITLLDEATTQ